MGGITGEENPSVLPPFGDQRPELIVHRPDDLEIVGRAAFRPVEPLPDVLWLYRLVGRFIIEDHKRPAPVIRPHLHRHARLFWFAELAQFGTAAAAALLFAVDHQPRLIEAEVFIADTERVAYETVAAIGADQVPATQFPDFAVLAFNRNVDPVTGLIEARDRPALEDITLVSDFAVISSSASKAGW